MLKPMKLGRRKIVLFKHGLSILLQQTAIWCAVKKTYTELDAINPHQIKNEIDLSSHLATVTNFRVYILLAGLDSHLDAAGAHVHRYNPLPDVLEAYAMICEEDIRLKTLWSEKKASCIALAAQRKKEVHISLLNLPLNLVIQIWLKMKPRAPTMVKIML
ncbi:hypothetical protein QYF36_005594 [Acer negundo]|nr:hypothetical protein QYF36_005594 [Acer negundo]